MRAPSRSNTHTHILECIQVAYGDLPETIEPEAFLHNMFSRGVCKMGTLARIARKEVLSLAALQKSMYSAPDTPDDLQGRG